jgi:hypothetical protein
MFLKLDLSPWGPTVQVSPPYQKTEKNPFSESLFSIRGLSPRENYTKRATSACR